MSNTKYSPRDSYTVLGTLLSECRNRDSEISAIETLGNRIDAMCMWYALGPVFLKALEHNSPTLPPVAETVAVLAACADDRRIGLGKVVAETFFASTKSPLDLVIFRIVYEKITKGSPFRVHPDWIAQKTLLRAAAIDGGLENYLEYVVKYRGVNRVSDLIHAALGSRTGGEQGWSSVAADETKRSLARAAFENTRVSAFENPTFSAFSGTSLAEVIDWGLRARDVGIITDDGLWLFYQRYEAEANMCDALQHRGAAREKRLRQWLLDRGGYRVTDALHEACVGLALSRRSA